MTTALKATSNISEAWLNAVEACLANRDGVSNLIVTLEPHFTVDNRVTELLDNDASRTGVHDTETVAGTIFPDGLYARPAAPWSPTDDERARRAEEAADGLFRDYVAILPELISLPGNSKGTYFGRLVAWPGNPPGPTNQLRERIMVLRRRNQAGHQRFNDAELDLSSASAEVDGLQLTRHDRGAGRGFPCLSHISLTLRGGMLSATALYRHQYVLNKAYGNLLGLGRLLEFVCEQTGYRTGELVVVATIADATRGDHQTVGRARQLLDEGRACIPPARHRD